jgi:hypothetical protein
MKPTRIGEGLDFAQGPIAMAGGMLYACTNGGFVWA